VRRRRCRWPGLSRRSAGNWHGSWPHVSARAVAMAVAVRVVRFMVRLPIGCSGVKVEASGGVRGSAVDAGLSRKHRSRTGHPWGAASGPWSDCSGPVACLRWAPGRTVRARSRVAYSSRTTLPLRRGASTLRNGGSHTCTSRRCRVQWLRWERHHRSEEAEAEAEAEAGAEAAAAAAGSASV
jgi:hypothetical protein